MRRARREEVTPVHYPCNYGGVVRARPDYRETQRATSVRGPIGGTSIKSRKPLIGVDVHARCRVESVRDAYLPRGRGGGYLLFFEARTRGDPDPESAVCLECVCAPFSFLTYFISRFLFSCKVPRDRKRTIWNAAGCAAKRALITMTRSKAAGILSAN